MKVARRMQHRRLVLTLQAFEILVIQSPASNSSSRIQPATRPLEREPKGRVRVVGSKPDFAVFPHYSGGVATEYLRPRQDQTAKVQSLDHAGAASKPTTVFNSAREIMTKLPSCRLRISCL